MKHSILLCMMVVGLSVVQYGSSSSIAYNCTEVCSKVEHHDESDTVHCGCHLHGSHSGTHGNHDKTTVLPETRVSTLGLCDYLCSIQQGGSACDCSVSIVPGK